MSILQHTSILAIGVLAAVALLLISALLDSSFPVRRPTDTALDNINISPLSMAVAPRFIRSTPSKQSTNSIPPVQVLVCVEALCIDSQRFFQDQLMIAFNALPKSVMNLTVVPFGNAKLPTDDDNSRNITCQHGLGECDTNAYEQCAIHLYPDPAQHVPYLACLFQALPMGHRDEPFEQKIGLEPCAHQHHLEFEKLKRCHQDQDLVWKLQQQAAQATPKRHDHVPWTEINGQYMNEEFENLLQSVCKVYHQAGGHTAGCSSILLDEEQIKTSWDVNVE